MINAIERNKISIDFIEDTLTSSIFELLQYLPAEVFWDILKKSIGFNKLPIKCGQLEYSEFWPHWNSENTANTKYVEPDLFLRFSEFDIVVEAKRHDTEQQYIEQWNNEIISYYNEHEGDDKKLFLLAIGGIKNDGIETILYNDKNIIILKCRWTTILYSITSIHTNLEETNFNLESLSQIKRILKSIIKFFNLHGFFTGDWFSNFETIKIGNSLNLLLSNEERYDSEKWFSTSNKKFKINDNSFLKLIKYEYNN